MRPWDRIVDKTTPPEFPGDGSQDMEPDVPEEAQSDNDGSEYESAQSRDDESTDEDTDHWTGFERSLYAPVAAENQIQHRVRSSHPALESVRAERGHMGWPDQYWGVNGLRVCDLNENPHRREGHGSWNPAEHPAVAEGTPNPSRPPLTVQTDFGNDAGKDSDAFPDIDPAILYMQQNDAAEVGPSTAGSHGSSQAPTSVVSGTSSQQHVGEGVDHQGRVDDTENDGKSTAADSSAGVTDGNGDKRNKKDNIQGKVKKLADRFKSLRRKRDKGPDGDGAGQGEGMAPAA